MSTKTVTSRGASHRGDRTPDSHGFATRPYDLVKEFVIALLVVTLLTVGLAAVFSSPDEKPITMSDWASNAQDDVIATVAGELAGTSASAGYGPPYNTSSEGQTIGGPLTLQKWGGVRIPVDSAKELVLDPLKTVSDPGVTAALAAWDAGSGDQQTKWATDYSEAITKAEGDVAKVEAGEYGPVPALATGFVALAKGGGLEGQLTSSGNFYGGDATKSLLLLSDGAYLEDQARARSLGGDQWGMMNEAGNYPGQPWMWLYTFWYQIPPFNTSDNADAQVWALMMLLTLVLALVPFIPGVRDIPRLIPIHRLVWRSYYRDHPRT